MSMKSSDPISGSPRGDLGSALSFAQNQGAKRPDQVEAYLREVFRLAPTVEIDPAIVVAQGAEETGNWTSSWWVNRLNPAGIGITGTAAQDVLSRTWESGADAARAHIVHLYTYAVGPISAGDELNQFRALDPRYQNVIDAGFAGIAPTIADLTGRWAEDPEYGDQVAGRGNSVFPTIPDAARAGGGTTVTPVFGRVPHPTFRDRLIPDSNTRAFNNLGQRSVKGVVYHRQLSATNMGTDGYFRSIPPGGLGNCSDNPNDPTYFDFGGCRGLTDYGVDHNTGEILRWNDPTGAPHPGVSANRAGWASGRVSNPYGDGKAFIDDNGGDIDVVNRDQVSIEISGFYVSDGHPVDDPISEACKDAVAGLSAYYADQFRISWDRYPKMPGRTYNFTRWHQEFCIGTGKICPGPLVMNETTDLINRTKAILKHFQEGGEDTLVPEDHELHPFPQDRIFHTTAGAVARQQPTRDSPIVRHFQPGEAITTDGFVHGQLIPEFGDDRWLQLSDPQHLTIHVSGVSEPI